MTIIVIDEDGKLMSALTDLQTAVTNLTSGVATLTTAVGTAVTLLQQIASGNVVDATANQCLGGFNSITVAGNNAQSGLLTNFQLWSKTGLTSASMPPASTPTPAP